MSVCGTDNAPFTHAERASNRLTRPAGVANQAFVSVALAAALSVSAPDRVMATPTSASAAPATPMRASSAGATAPAPPREIAASASKPTDAARPAPTAAPAGGPSPSNRAAYAFEPDVQCPYCGITPEHPTGRFGLHWHEHWRHVGLPEYILAPTLFAAAGVFGLGVIPERETPNWTGPILFDAWARRHLAMKSSSGRKAAGTVSDAFLYATIGQTTVLDNLVVAWAVRQNPEVAWQMLAINSQVYALTLALNGATKYLTGRERPWVDRCTADSTDQVCSNGSRMQSFYSGHAAVTATGAGLVCAHHTQLNLYTSPAADTAACATSVALSLATATLRISSENHWASDVIVGELVGFGAGYVLPTLVYYRKFRVEPTPTPSAPVTQMALLPVVGAHSLEIMAVGLL
jgi:hypothetical protein